MHDQSLDRVNGRSTAAIATICERMLNIVSVLKSAGETRMPAGSMGQRYAQIFLKPSSANLSASRFVDQ
jgi:hypothetical protein